MKKLTLVIFAMLTIFVSCKKDSDNKSNNKSRTLKYEATGNFSGTLTASYTTAAGGTANDAITLPYNKEITYASNVTAAIIALSGGGGVAGQKVTLVIKRGGSQVGTPIEFVAEGSSGGFSKAAPVVVF